MFTCVGWKVTLCDPTWQVTLRNCERLKRVKVNICYSAPNRLSHRRGAQVHGGAPLSCLLLENNTGVIFLIVQQLVESYNYGLYYPPANGRAGKFLDEERCMSEYPLSGSVGQLEVLDLYHYFALCSQLCISDFYLLMYPRQTVHVSLI